MIEAEDLRDENFWGVIGDFIEFLGETEVNLLTVLILFLAYGAREFVGMYLKRKHRYDPRS